VPTPSTGFAESNLVSQFSVFGEEVFIDEFPERWESVVSVIREAPVRAWRFGIPDLWIENDDGVVWTAECFDMRLACLRSVDTINKSQPQFLLKSDHPRAALVIPVLNGNQVRFRCECRAGRRSRTRRSCTRRSCTRRGYRHEGRAHDRDRSSSCGAG